MKTKNHVTLLLTLLFVVLHSSAQAQDKYEHGVVTYTAGNPNMKNYKIVSSLNDKITTEKGTVSEDNAYENYGPLNMKLNSLSEDGWEVYNTDFIPGVAGGRSFYVRKKKM